MMSDAPRAVGPACNNCGARSWSYEGRDEPICGECGHAMPTPGIGAAPRAEGLATSRPSVTEPDLDRALIEKGRELANSILRWNNGHVNEGHAQEFMRLYGERAASPSVPPSEPPHNHGSFGCDEHCPAFDWEPNDAPSVQPSEPPCNECGKPMDDCDLRILDKDCLYRLRSEAVPPSEREGLDVRHTVEVISEELQHYDLSDDPGYIKVPTERVRAILAARLSGERGE